jgi:hypothetical protein
MATTPDKAAVKRTGANRSRGKATAIPANVKQPGDHRPAKEDVEGPKSVTVEWHGHEYLIAGENVDDVEVLEHLTDDNPIGALRLMLGPDLWAEYKENERNPKTGRTTASGAGEFLNHILQSVDRKN